MSFHQQIEPSQFGGVGVQTCQGGKKKKKETSENVSIERERQETLFLLQRLGSDIKRWICL